MADALAFLREPVLPMERFSRWADWERDVLARLPEPAEVQTVIRERQAVADVEREEADLIEEFFASRLAELGYAANTDRIFIPTGVAAKWLEAATNDRTTVTKASRSIRQKINEGQFRRLMECPNRHHGRGFEWWGADATGQSDLRVDIEHQIEIHQKQSRTFRGNSFE